MDADSTLRTVSNVPKDTSRQDLFVKKDVLLINFMMLVLRDVLHVVQLAKPAPLSASVLHVKIPISLLEVEFVLIVPTPAQPATAQEPVLLVLVDSTTSKENANTHVHWEPDQSMESVNVHLESFHQANV